MYVAEYKCPCCDGWRSADSIGGVVGECDVYDCDLMQAALDKLHEVERGNN